MSKTEKSSNFTSKLRKKFKSAADSAVDELSRDAAKVRDQIVLPTVRYGKNRIVSTVAGAKTGALIGAKVAGPYGLFKGAAVGAFLGAVGGPKAMAKVEDMLNRTKASNDNDPDGDKPDQKNEAKEEKPAVSDNKPDSPSL